METIKHEDLKCEFCDGKGEKEKFVEPYGDSPVICTFCNGTGIDEDQLRKAFLERFSSSEPCAICGCSIEAHSETMVCPSFFAGNFEGWLDTKFLVR